MNRQSKLRAQIALTTAVCFATVATFAAAPPAASDPQSCRLPAWTPAWIGGLEGDGCR